METLRAASLEIAADLDASNEEIAEFIRSDTLTADEWYGPDEALEYEAEEADARIFEAELASGRIYGVAR